MTKTTDKTTSDGLGRRDLLKVLSLGAGAAAVAVPASVTPAMAQENDNDKKKARYRESDHVKAFYRTNRY
jgi:hypothetical protein